MLDLSHCSVEDLIKFHREVTIIIEHGSHDGLSDMILEINRAIIAEKDSRLLHFSNKN